MLSSLSFKDSMHIILLARTRARMRYAQSALVLARVSPFDNKAQDEETVPAPFLRNFHRRQGVFYYISQ